MGRPSISNPLLSIRIHPPFVRAYQLALVIQSGVIGSRQRTNRAVEGSLPPNPIHRRIGEFSLDGWRRVAADARTVALEQLSQLRL
jgi:hypothetical protein